MSARCTSFQLRGRGHDPRKNQVLRLGILPIFPMVLIHLPVLFWARLWLFLDRILWIFELHFGVNLQEFFCGSGSGTPVNSCTHLWWSDATGQACGGCCSIKLALAPTLLVSRPRPQSHNPWNCGERPLCLATIPWIVDTGYVPRPHSPDMWHEASLLSTSK